MDNKNKKVITIVAFLLTFTSIILIASSSYAYFKKEIDVNKRVDIQVGTLSYNLESDELNNKQVTISSNSYKNIEMDLTSLNKINSKYQLYYELITNLTNDEKSKLDVGYFYLSDDKTSGTIDKDENKKMIITIVNGNNKDITLNIGVIGGLINNEIELNSNQYKIEKSKTLIDYSGNNYYGTFMNGADIIYDEDEGMYAIDFDGIDDFVDIVDLPASIDWENGFTVEFTAKWDEFNNYSRILDFGNGPYHDNIIIFNHGKTNGLRTDFYSNNLQIAAFKYDILEKNNVDRYKIVYHKENVEFYKNGIFIGENIYQYSIRNVKRILNYLGKANSEEDDYFDGKIYNLKITEADGDVVLWYNPSMIFDFDYNGTDGSDGYEQVFNVPLAGTYKLETWGAQGGICDKNDARNIKNYGSYSYGYIEQNKDSILYVNTGGQGTYGLHGKGGYNGGGDGAYGAHWVSGGGGGATSISLKNGLLSELSNSVQSLMIISGGGGGVYGVTPGGAAGGYIGNNGYYYSNDLCGTGASQDKGGLGHTSDFGTSFGGTFGKGGDGGETNADGGGGGGGFYGGGGCPDNGAGGGGSGYIGNELLKNKIMYCYNCATSDVESTKTETTSCAEETPTENCAKIGHGYARITYVKAYSNNNYTITYNSNGGNGTMNTQKVEYGTDATLSENKFTRDGYKFVGWSINKNVADVNNLISNVDHFNGQFSKIDTNSYELDFTKGTKDSYIWFNLNANIYKENNYELIFNANLASDNFNTTFAFPDQLSNIFHIKSGLNVLEFNNWHNLENGSKYAVLDDVGKYENERATLSDFYLFESDSINYKDKDTITNNTNLSNINLYAVWLNV